MARDVKPRATARPERGPAVGGAARTIGELWRRAAREPAANPPYLVEDGRAWREVGWDEAAERVESLASGFLSLGVAKGDRVALMSRTRLEWTLCDLALASIGAVVVPVYTVGSTDEKIHIVTDSGARILVAERARDYAPVEPPLAELGALDEVIAIEPFPGARLSLAELEARGRERLRLDPKALDEARAAVTADDALTIVYTSGATGLPKGCVHTHGNWRSMVESIRRVPGLVEPGDRVVLHLPLSHVFARLVGFMTPAAGLTVTLCPDSSSLRAALRMTSPTLFPSVPLVYETIARSVEAGLDEQTGLRRRLAERALAAGRKASRRRQAGRRLGPLLAAELALADRLVFSKVKARLGGNLRAAISGGAPLAREVAEFFASVGILVLEGYGLTECTTVVSVNRPDRYRFGTVGEPPPGVEVRIAEDDEILVRGETLFGGYLNDEAATAAAFTDDGWLRTGDLGAFDEDGFLSVVGRKKEIIVLSNGANIPPENIEKSLRASKYVNHALVVGDRQPHLAALVAVNRREARKVARTDEEVAALVAEVVADVNSRLGPEEKVKRFALLDRDFLPELDEVTPNQKLKRRVCEEHFREEIERLYAAPRTPLVADQPEA